MHERLSRGENVGYTEVAIKINLLTTVKNAIQQWSKKKLSEVHWEQSSQFSCVCLPEGAVNKRDILGKM